MKRVTVTLFPEQIVKDGSGIHNGQKRFDIAIPLQDYRKIFTSIDDFDGDIITRIFKYYVKNISAFDPIFANEGFLSFLNLIEAPNFSNRQSAIYRLLTDRWYGMSPSRQDDYPHRPFVSEDELVALGVRSMLAPPVSLKDGVVSVKGYKKKAGDINREVNEQRRAYDRKMLMLAADSQARKSSKHVGATGKRKLIHKWQKQTQGRHR